MEAELRIGLDFNLLWQKILAYTVDLRFRIQNGFLTDCIMSYTSLCSTQKAKN